MRAFVAIEVSDDLRRSLRRLQERLEPVAKGVRWVKPELVHLTLKFLGEVPDFAAPRACALVGDCAKEVRPFSLTFSGLGAFPSPDRPRVIWTGAEDDPAVMAELSSALDKALTEVGVGREKRGFRPHLTLGRVRRPRPQPDLALELRKGSGETFGEVLVTEIVLMQSELRPSGPIYTPLSRHPLGVAGDATRESGSL